MVCSSLCSAQTRPRIMEVQRSTIAKMVYQSIYSPPSLKHLITTCFSNGLSNIQTCWVPFRISYHWRFIAHKTSVLDPAMTIFREHPADWSGSWGWSYQDLENIRWCWNLGLIDSSTGTGYLWLLVYVKRLYIELCTCRPRGLGFTSSWFTNNNQCLCTCSYQQLTSWNPFMATKGRSDC